MGRVLLLRVINFVFLFFFFQEVSWAGLAGRSSSSSSQSLLVVPPAIDWGGVVVG